MEMETIGQINTDLKEKLGYTPYIAEETGKVLCAACHTDRSNDTEATLTKTKSVPDRNGDSMLVHECKGCRYMNGINIPLKQRIVKLRKELDLQEFPIGDKFQNHYEHPEDKYFFIVPQTNDAAQLSEKELVAGIEEMNERINNGNWEEEESFETDDSLNETNEVSTEEGNLNEFEDEFQNLSTESEEIVIGTRSVVEVERIDEAAGTTTKVDAAEVFDKPAPAKKSTRTPKKKAEPLAEIVQVVPTVSEEAAPVIPVEVVDVNVVIPQAVEHIDVTIDVSAANEPTPEEVGDDLDDLFGGNSEDELIIDEADEDLPETSDEDLDSVGDIDSDDSVGLENDESEAVLAKQGDNNVSDFFDGNEDLDAIFGGTEEVAQPEPITGDASSLITEFDENSDNFDNFFNRSAEEIAAESNAPADDFDGGFSRSGSSDVKVTPDPLIEKMINENKDSLEDDVFDLDLRNQDMSVSSLINKSRVGLLIDNYNTSEAKFVVDAIVKAIEKRSHRKIKSYLTINELTHECPVIDFEGNIRIIFVDTTVDGGRYDIQSDINSKLRNVYAETSEFELMTFTIFSDQIEGRKRSRVINAIIKHIVFNLKITGVITPVSIIEDSDRYFYTTLENDADTIKKFDDENNAGAVEKPANGEVAIISHWQHPEMDEQYLYRKSIQNRAIMMNGGEINYTDMQMYMTCSMKYIILPQKPNGVINVTIVDYIETSNLFIKDGFGVCVGAIMHNIKSQYPQSQIDLYYEMDVSMIPSPVISRYFKNDSIRMLNIDPNVVALNKIAKIVANQNDAKIDSIPVEGEPFDAPEYQTPVSRTFLLAPEFRRISSDDKRLDWRRFGKKTFAKTIGAERMKDYRGVDLSDRKVRASIAEKLGFVSIIQPQVIKAVVTPEFTMKAFMKVLQTFSGVFSISQFIKMNKSQIVDDNYMKNGQNNMYMNPAAMMGIGGGQDLNQYNQMAQLQQQMLMMQQMQQMNGLNGGMMGMGGFGFPMQ